MEKILNDYEINENTMALLPVAHMDYSTIVLEPHQRLLVRKTPLQLIKAACLKTHCSYEGRRTAIIHETGYKRKVPVAINPDKNIYAFPTHSPTKFTCKWIFRPHVKSLKNTSPTLLMFNNEQEIEIDESFHVIEKQMERTITCMWKTRPDHGLTFPLLQPLQFSPNNQLHSLVTPNVVPPVPEKV